MKSLSRWIFWLVLERLTVCLVGCEFFILSGPEYSSRNLYYTYQQLRDMYCITDEIGSALTWNSNLKWEDSNLAHLNVVKRPSVLPNDKYVHPMSNNFICQMSNINPCSRYWSRIGNWSYVTSLKKPMSPVFDNRWEDFPEEMMTKEFRFMSVLPGTGSIAISIRGVTDAHFAVCNSHDPRSFCFYIILGGWWNSKSVIRKCEKGIPDPATKLPSDDCLNPVDTFNGTVLSATEWKSFLIKWDFRTQISLSVYDSSARLLSYTMPKKENYFTGFSGKATGNVEYFLFARSTTQIIIKLHIYGYSFTTTRQSKLISPEIMTASSNRSMCIEMSISLCEKCLLTVDFVDRNGQKRPAGTFLNKNSNNLYGLPSWWNEKINKTLSTEMQPPITLAINTLLSNSTIKNTPFWAVTNIRRCYNGALKVTKINAYQDYGGSSYFWPNITCQKLSADGVSTIIESTDHRITTTNSENRSLCSEGKIGLSCSVTCSKLFEDNADCQKLLACDETGCSCAQGFTLPSCSEHCPASTYGFECNRKCGNCAHVNCSFATGECTLGCENNENSFFLAPYCENGITSPPAPNVDLINSTFIRLSLGMMKEYKIIPTSINFEIWSNSTSPYFLSENITVQSNTVSLETYAEHLNPGTKYRAVGIVHAENRTFRGEWGNFTTPCTESAALNFVTTSNETSITLDNWVDVLINDSCPYTWYRVQLFSAKDKLFDGTTAFPKTFVDLKPFTQFKIIVSSEKINIIKLVATLEGAPGPVKTLQVIWSSVDKISIVWQPPDETRGKIVNYTAEIEAIESLGCSDLNKPSYNSLTGDIGVPLKMQAVIANTSQKNFNLTFNGLKPYTRYLITVYAYTFKYTGEKKVVVHATAATDVPIEVCTNLRLTNETSATAAANLRWDFPTDCSVIAGPIHVSKVFIGKSDIRLMDVETNDNYFALEKSIFEGDEAYEVRIHFLRRVGGLENKTAYTGLKFTMPARAPPPVRNFEIIEIDVHNKITTLRWETPLSPLHGKLHHYSIVFCSSDSKLCSENEYVAYFSEFCKPWNYKYKNCKTVLLPDNEYDQIYIRAHNTNVTEASEPVTVPVKRTEFEPTAPTNLSMDVVNREIARVNILWSHPLLSGGRLVKFTITTRVLNSSLRIIPWMEKINMFEIGEASYQLRYSIELDLLPSSSFAISVWAITAGGVGGARIEGRITLPTFVNFSSGDLRPIANDDLTIAIRIPEVMFNVKNSVMVVVVQGPKYCDEGLSNNEDVNFLLYTQSSSYYKVIWKAATWTEPESYANKEFKIGDGAVYGGSKNYALCSKESYIVRVALMDGPKNVDSSKFKVTEANILRSIETNAIHLGDIQKNYAAWLTPLFFIILLAILLLIIVYRRKLTSRFVKHKPKPRQQENIPLHNDINEKKSNNSVDEVEAGIKTKDTKDVPNNNIFIIDKKLQYLMPVKVEDFGNYFESAYKSGALKKEYSTIKSRPTKPCTYGSQSETKPKNRYANLFPYDETRVILEKLPDDPYSDYINANFITGYGGKEKAYIATQGPKPNTVIDFWRMIWQEKVRIICMMANLVENGKVKCEQYWPSVVGKKTLYGAVWVQFSSKEVHSDYTYRTFRVFCGNEEARMIDHLHYTAWPDHRVPSNPRSILAFLNEMQRHAPAPRKPDEPPIVVHCSAGVGRTGTLIVLDISVCRAFAEQVIDVFATVLSVRKQRLNMVDNTDQYLLVHLVLVEYLNSKNACFTCDKTLPERIVEAKKNSMSHYQWILDTNWWNEILGSPSIPEKTLSNRNRAKHRFPESAGGLNRLYLKRSLITDEDSDYIAATSVKGIFKNYQYITTQLPMPSTTADFWRMISEQNVEFMLVLQLPDLEVPTYCELVPENQEFGNTKYLKIVRQENSTTDIQYYTIEKVLVIDSSEPSREQIVKIISYKKWSETLLPDPHELVKLWKILEEFPKKENYPIVIVCRNGVTASGLWLTLSFLLKKMTVDNECDVPQAVREIRRCRKDFLNQPEYLDYLYDVALAWFVDS